MENPPCGAQDEMRFAPFFGILSQSRARGKRRRGKLKKERGKWGIFEGAGVNKRRGEGTPPYNALFRQGGREDGVTDCHGQCAHWPRNDMGFCMGCGGFLRVRRGGALPRPQATARVAPTEALPACGGESTGGQGHRPLRRVSWGAGVHWVELPGEIGMIWVEMKIWGLCFLYFYIIMKC